jgi:integrase
LTPDEARALIAAAKEPTRTAIVLSLLTGLRRSNITGTYKPIKRGILWGDVDLEQQVFRLPGSVMKNGEDFAQPLSNQLHAFLRARLRELGRVPPPEEQIVRPHDSKPPWHAALKKSGILGKFRWHDMRHTTAAWIAAKCTDSVARMLLGHTKTGAVTPGYTDHQTLAALRDGLNAALPDLVDASGKPIPNPDLTGQKTEVIMRA